MPDCYLKIGNERYEGLEAGELLAGLRQGQPVEIGFAGCSPDDQHIMRAVYDKWRQDSTRAPSYRPWLYAGLALVVLALAQVWRLLSQASPESGGGDSVFADKSSMHAFLGTIALILAVVVVFLRRLGRLAQEQGTGARLKDTELSRLLAKGYTLVLEDDKLTLTPRAG